MFNRFLDLPDYIHEHYVITGMKSSELERRGILTKPELETDPIYHQDTLARYSKSMPY